MHSTRTGIVILVSAFICSVSYAEEYSSEKSEGQVWRSECSLMKDKMNISDCCRMKGMECDEKAKDDAEKEKCRKISNACTEETTTFKQATPKPVIPK